LKKYIVCFLLLACPIVWGQMNDHEIVISIPEIAILDIESVGGAGRLMDNNLSGQTGHYLDPDVSRNADFWLNYSSICRSSTDPSRKITAEISEGHLPDSRKVYLSASPYSGSGDGRLGTPTGEVLLSTYPQVVIAGIGSSYTGDGAFNGHNLLYSVVNRNKIPGGSEESEILPILITFTISDN
jgi:hypothetical protein